MMDQTIAMVLFLVCVMASSCAQISLKMGTTKQYQGIMQYLNPYVIFGYGIFFAMTLCSTYLYRYISIVSGTILDSFGYIFVSVLSIIFFKEHWSKKKTLGLIFIVIGTMLVLLV